MPAEPSAPAVLVVGYLSLDTLVVGGVVHADVPGGAALYAALGAARAGAAVHLVAARGTDLPQAVVTGLVRGGVDVRALVRRAHPTRRTRIEQLASGRRRSPHYRSAAWRAATRALVPPSPRGRGRPRAVVLTAMPAVSLRPWIQWARARGARLVLDTSEFFAARERAALLGLVRRVDCFAPSRDETRLLLPGIDDDAALRALARRCPRVVQKRGPDGLVLMSAAHPGGLRAPAPRVAVVDPTGAGDAVAGALGAGLAAGLDDPGLLALARRVAARAVRGLGPGRLGLVLMSAAHPGGLRAPAPRVAVVDRTGAGDAVAGALGAGLAAGLDDPGLLALARRVAARAVRGLGPGRLGLG